MRLADGTDPGNEGRCYVRPRILRRVVRSVRLVGYEEQGLPALLPVASDCTAPSWLSLFGPALRRVRGSRSLDVRARCLA